MPGGQISTTYARLMVSRQSDFDSRCDLDKFVDVAIPILSAPFFAVEPKIERPEPPDPHFRAHGGWAWLCSLVDLPHS
jgi:hypothetical protein